MPWGSGFWGASGWGDTVSPDLRLVGALAVRENVVRLAFNKPPRFSGLLDPNDASDPRRYDVRPVAGTRGLDGRLVRDVDPVEARLAAVAGAGGRLVDLVVDRPFSPWPARYVASVNQLVGAGDGGLLGVGHTSVEFPAVYAGLAKPDPQRAVARRDFANPQSLAGLVEANPGDPSMLATYVADETGDYAADDGLVSYKKRVYRRLTTEKGRFAHLRDYGLSVKATVKQLSRRGAREALAADAEDQVRREPETQDVAVDVLKVIGHPEIALFRIRARVSFTSDRLEFDVPYAGT